jgi:dihydroorotase
MKSLFDAGCPALTNYYYGIKNLNVLRHCYEYAATFDIPVFIYPQMTDLAEGACAHEGHWATKLGLPGISETAETIAIATHLLLIEQTGVRAHFSQLSCARSIALLEQALAKRRLKITADVAAHQLFLDDSCLETFNSLYKLCPPLRSKNDIKGLLKGIEKGVISSICSSHQPHEADAKLLPFESAEYGISALETLLPLSIKLANPRLSLMEILRKLTQNPAELLNIKRKGIVVGEKADLCIFNNKADWEFNPQEMLSAGKNSPFAGEHFSAKNDYTFIDGKLVFVRKQNRK